MSLAEMRYVGRMPAQWGKVILRGDAKIGRDDERHADILQLVKIWSHQGEPWAILDKYEGKSK